MILRSKLASEQVTIFTEMSALANLHGAINLGQGFPNYDPPAKLTSLIDFYIGQSKHQYAPMAGVIELRKAISKKNYDSYDIFNSPDDEITITAGATQAIFTAITAFVHTGDEVIIFEPAYDSYRPSILIAGGRPVIYALEGPDFAIDWDLVSKLVTSKTKMIIINTPHNPTATILKEKDLESLSAIVKGTEIIVLSDEVYEHLVFDGKDHQSILKYPELYSQSIAVFSFGKTYHCTGWKIGYCIAPSNITKEFRKVHQWNVFSVNSFLQYALADFISDHSDHKQLPHFYGQKRNLFLHGIKSSRFTPLHSQGSFFQLCDYSNISDLDDVDFAKELIIKHGVACIPISVFYSDQRQQNIVRFCFAKTEDTLVQAAKILSKV